jgi:hypothetical protein
MASTLLDIKDFLYTLCKSSVSSNILPSIPTVIPATISDFVVISTPTPISDFSDYTDASTGEGMVLITLFARGTKSAKFGTEQNVVKLSTMLSSLREALRTLGNQSDFRLLEQGYYEARTTYEGFNALSIILNLKTL